MLRINERGGRARPRRSVFIVRIRHARHRSDTLADRGAAALADALVRTIDNVGAPHQDNTTVIVITVTEAIWAAGSCAPRVLIHRARADVAPLSAD